MRIGPGNRGSCAFPDGLITALPSAERQAVSRPDDHMKKEILIFGAVVVLCLGVTAFALMKPKAKPIKTDLSSSSSFASTDTPGSSSSTDFPSSSSSTSPGSLGTSDSFSSTSSLYPPTADLNPNKPFDATGTGVGHGPGVGSTPAGNPFPGSSSSSSFPNTSPSSTGTGLGSAGSTTSGTGLTSGSSLGPAKPLLDPVPTVGETKTHIVKKGEILGDISRKYYGSSKHWRKIADANNIKAEGLKEGMKLTIPPLDVAPVAATGTDTTGADAGTYVVKKGDSYYKIAKKELGDASRYKELEKLNGVAAEDLHEGQKIKLPAKSSTGHDVGTIPMPGPEAATGGRTHTVASGEYLSDISKKYYGSTKHWQEIVAANPGLTPEHLKVGQKLVIPELAGKSTAVGPTVDVAAATDEWIVKKGDTFEVIAAKTLGDKSKWKKIQEVNPGVDSGNLKIGQKIKLPAGAKGSEAVPIPKPIAPLNSFPAPANTLPGPSNTFPSGATPAPKSALPGPATDPWAPLPSAPSTGTGSTTTGGTTGTGTNGASAAVPYSDPWKDFSTPTTGTTTGTGTGIKP